jgi:hypothetical protein
VRWCYQKRNLKKGKKMNFNIQLNLDEVNVVLAALGKLPLEASIGAFEKIKAQAQQQAQAQQTQPQEESAPE